MSDDTVTIEVNGEPVEARKGEMIIEVTDRTDAYVPRFCYHSKLSVAANCRMCLVEVEKAPKPLPACATPVMDGMKVFTRSPVAISAQKATMEFLLINHPLDCPICDQGGECELQDLAMGFGRDVSRYTERKRVVKDKNLGPLVSTDMTRCIHCTRCVRFGQEIAGIQELGTVGRAEHMEIGTYIEASVDHELSGNIIDLCPVGALNNKPYRFSARAWEMVAKPLVSPHDCLGSNLYAHVLRGTVKRIVPRDNDDVNETWIADRDRFSYEGIYSDDRLLSPRLKVDDEWQEASWSSALSAAVEAIQSRLADSGDAFGFLVSPNATLEEAYLLNRVARHLGSHNIDHRLRQRDFRDQDQDVPWPWLGSSIAELEQHNALLLVGSDIRHEVPMLAHRVRKAALAGCKVSFINREPSTLFFDTEAYLTDELTKGLAAAVAAAAEQTSSQVPARVAKAVSGVSVNDEARAIAKSLSDGGRSLILLGHESGRHPAFAELRSLAAALAELTGATLGYISEGANAAGACQAGVLPHRTVAGHAVKKAGLDALSMLRSPRKIYVLFNIEPNADLADAALAREGLGAADHVIALSPYVTPALEACCDVILPIGSFAETDGTFINAEGRSQTFDAAAKPVGEARPGWKVLRVLAEALGVPEAAYDSAAEIREALAAEAEQPAGQGAYGGHFAAEALSEDVDDLAVPIYSVDGLVRRGIALQKTAVAGGSSSGQPPVGGPSGPIAAEAAPTAAPTAGPGVGGPSGPNVGPSGPTVEA